MDTDHAIITSFIQRLENRELNGHLMDELSKLSYDQRILLSKTLAERSLKTSKGGGTGIPGRKNQH